MTTLGEAIDIVCDFATPFSGIPGVVQFGQITLFTEDERQQLYAMRDLIEQYIARPAPRRPLSLAVFGPPGSGKSFAVDQILAALKLSSINVNLTQVSDASELGEVLLGVVVSPGTTVPVIFFDEFDAPRAGAPYGWLSWFLAPMQDGGFLYKGKVIPLRRAVYVFAGGTATTMRQFSDFARLSEFQRAKGPDFVSRLRGFLDVCGPNTEPRLLRRAVLLRSELSRAVKNPGTFSLDRDLVESLLQAGRYRHGARSISAVVELSHLEKKTSFGWADLPTDHLLELHIDRGPLDSKLISGSIAFSGYDEKAEVKAVWSKVALTLWNEGATLSYAGRWSPGPGGDLMKFLKDELRKRSPEPSADQDRRSKPSPWLECFLDAVREEHVLTDNAVSEADRERIGLKVTFAPHLTLDERIKLDRWLLSGLEHFRRRLAVADVSVARFVIAGARTGYYGRFPGIPEEVMLTLAQGKPIYVVGAFGGAAADVGSLLGLAHPRKGEVPISFQAEPREAEARLLTIADKLRPGPWTELPITAAELVHFLKQHAIGGSHWPDNGLSFEENRCLFAAKDPDAIAELVLKGLLRLSAKSDPVVAAA